MINQKYYHDIKQFTQQFQRGLKLASNTRLSGSFERIVLCGMGGSSFYAEMINDYLNSNPTNKIKIEPCRSYNLPSGVNENTLFIVCSHSGNTQETLSTLDQIEHHNYPHLILTSGGKLQQRAQQSHAPLIIVPTGTQPRLSTGYFIGALLKVLENCKLIESKEQELLAIANQLNQNLDEPAAQQLAKELKDLIPIIYTTENNTSLGRVAKIKFNENSKIQSFYSYFPELNHNEMVGFTKLLMRPYFIIFKSKFTNPHNYQRMDIFLKLMHERNLTGKIIPMKGNSSFAEILNAYYFIDHVTYYLAQEYGIDPEPVDMVEDFKRMLEMGAVQYHNQNKL